MLLWWWCGMVASGGGAGTPVVFLPIFALNTNAVLGLPVSQAK